MKIVCLDVPRYHWHPEHIVLPHADEVASPLLSDTCLDSEVVYIMSTLTSTEVTTKDKIQVQK